MTAIMKRIIRLQIMGVIIEEVNEDERNEAVDEEQEGIGNVQEEQEEAEEEDDLWNGHTLMSSTLRKCSTQSTRLLIGTMEGRV